MRAEVQYCIFNPRHARAGGVQYIVGLCVCVCVSVCLSVCYSSTNFLLTLRVQLKVSMDYKRSATNFQLMDFDKNESYTCSLLGHSGKSTVLIVLL